MNSISYVRLLRNYTCSNNDCNNHNNDNINKNNNTKIDKKEHVSPTCAIYCVLIDIMIKCLNSFEQQGYFVCLVILALAGF